MPRNTTFRPQREPFRHTDNLQLTDKINGPFSFLNPTQAHFTAVQPTKATDASNESQSSEQVSQAEHPSKTANTSHASEHGDTSRSSGRDAVPASDIAFKWTSRNNRKGRHALVYQPSDSTNAPYVVPPPTNTIQGVLEGLWRMATYYPIWDVSYLVAVVFTWGSVIWVLNAFFSLLPYTNPASIFPGEVLYGGGITAFIGATVFEFGSVLLMLEAVNENRVGCFGWALEKVYNEHFEHGGDRQSTTRVTASKAECIHHHQNKHNFVGQPSEQAREKLADNDMYADPTPQGDHSWVWYPSWQELKSHYSRDLGFLACSAQMFGATVFWISGITALPGIYTVLDTTAKVNGAYWIPQIIGGSGFVVSGTLFMIETQKHWWQPAPSVLGWHIGLWNLIGGVGFTICPIFGLYAATQHWAAYQASCSTFWGSWAFLIGSVVQWYESLDKHPVEKL